MTKLLTRKEHIARAMLMGREYDETDGTYCTSDGHMQLGWVIDCVTLEVVDWDNMGFYELQDFKNRGKWEK